MIQTDFHKTAKFLRLVASWYGLLVVTGSVAFIFPTSHRGLPVSAMFQVESDPHHWIKVNRSCDASRQILGFHLECLIEDHLIGSIAASFFIACAAIYYGILHNAWRKQPETGWLCDHFAQYKAPKIKAGFLLVVSLISLACTISIVHMIVLIKDLKTTNSGENSSDYLIYVIKRKLASAFFATTFISFNLALSFSLYKKFYKWDFSLEDMRYMAPLTEHFALPDPPQYSEAIAMARRETDWPPEYSPRETAV